VTTFLFAILVVESLHQAIGHRATLRHTAVILPAWTIHRLRRRFVHTGTRVKRPVKAVAEQPAITAPTAQKALTA